MQILLFNQKKDNIIEVKENTVLDELYNYYYQKSINK